MEIAESSTDLAHEHGQLEEQIKETNGSRTALTQDSREPEQVNTQANQGIEDKTVLLGTSRKGQETCTAVLPVPQMRAANLCQKQNFIRGNADRVFGEIEKLTEEFNLLAEGTGNSEQVVEGKRREITYLRELIQNTMVRMKELEQVMAGYELGKGEVPSRQKAFLAKWGRLATRLVELDKDMLRIQAQREKLGEKPEVSTTYVRSEYEMAYSMALELKREEYQSVPGVKKLIDELKSRIKGLGDINVNAVEGYKGVSGHYGFMRTQHENLATTQAELEKTIEELDTEAWRQSEEKFGETRAEFGKAFKELLGDGRGTLKLMEDEDILEAGIQITAQPPGEKLQSMIRLSSGEKAPTVISLLFAIQNLKPSPFCLLDEVEATLDDSNVDRFAGYLHKLTGDTQFIAITHKRDTMVSTDCLYGIIMQEKGVSTLVNMSLIADDLDK